MSTRIRIDPHPRPIRAARDARRLSAAEPELPVDRAEPIGQGTTLTFAPAAFLKLLHQVHAAPGEIAGFGVCSDVDPLYVERFALLAQTAGPVTAELDDGAVAAHVEDLALEGVPPARCARVWIHSHPGQGSEPSGVDERTFARAFGGCDWSVMAIVARGGAGGWSARLQFPAGPGGRVALRVQLDWPALPGWLRENAHLLPHLAESWDRELSEKVRPEPTTTSFAFGGDDVLTPFLRRRRDSAVLPLGIRRGIRLAEDEDGVEVVDEELAAYDDLLDDASIFAPWDDERVEAEADAYWAEERLLAAHHRDFGLDVDDRLLLGEVMR